MKNGYNESLLNTEDGKCFLCGKVCETARHEVFFGTANRQNSKKYGMWVDICPMCHQYSSTSVHQNRATDLHLKKTAQREFERVYSRECFIRVFGRNYED